ncbi:MAG: N-acetylmuramoyl-L-alanine amidase [Devosia sp.]
METKYGFVKLASSEFSTWLNQQSISRTCLRVQEHHTWKPRYSNFTGSNHFEMQRSMRHHHVNNNGWSDIGQHFSIFPDGAIVTGRPLNRSPACIFNANSAGICIENVGNFDLGGDVMAAEQADSMFLVTALLLSKIGISTPTKTNVVYHHWYDGSGNLVYDNSGQKSCPGTDFFGGNKLNDFEVNFLPRLRSAMGAGGQPPIDLEQWAVVTADNLNVRTQPSGSAPLSNEQGPLSFGAVVRVYEVSANNWFRVSQTRQRWISGRYTDPVRRATVNTNDTNARIGPGMGHDVERVFQSGDKVFVHTQAGQWHRIVEDLWIHDSLLDLE